VAIPTTSTATAAPGVIGSPFLENGDKIFGEFSGASQTVVAADGSKKSTFSGVVVYTGGTGKYQGIRGLQRESSQFDPEKNFSQAQADAEYWLEK
jgi:hypothetical protein